MESMKQNPEHCGNHEVSNWALSLRGATLPHAGIALTLYCCAAFHATAGPLLLLTSGAVVSTATSSFTDRRDNLTAVSGSLFRDQSYPFSYTDPNVPGSLDDGSFEAQGVADYGVLKATIITDQDGTASHPSVDVFSSALWQDALTFTTASSSGTAILTFTLDGTGSATYSPGFGIVSGVHSQEIMRFYAGLVPGGSIPFTDYDSTEGVFSLDTKYTATIPFVSGVPASIEATVGTNIVFSCDTGFLGEDFNCMSWHGSGILNFGDTAILSGIELLDSSGTPISSFSIQSASGTTYTADGVIPEPSTFLLLAVGLLPTLALRNRRKL
jgi:hypothetical protein